MKEGKSEVEEVSNMRTFLSVVIIIVAAFVMGSGMNEEMTGATLFAMIAGFACTIQAIESKKKR